MKLSNQSHIKKTINKIISPWYLLPLIDRWLLGQIIPPMIFAISAFTVISLSVGVMFDLIRKVVEYGLPIFLALKVIFFPKVIYFKTKTLIKFENLREFSREAIPIFFLKLICPNIFLNY